MEKHKSDIIRDIKRENLGYSQQKSSDPKPQKLQKEPYRKLIRVEINSYRLVN